MVRCKVNFYKRFYRQILVDFNLTFEAQLALLSMSETQTITLFLSALLVILVSQYFDLLEDIYLFI